MNTDMINVALTVTNGGETYPTATVMIQVEIVLVPIAGRDSSMPLS
jgi:hypothetical protein